MRSPRKKRRRSLGTSELPLDGHFGSSHCGPNHQHPARGKTTIEPRRASPIAKQHEPTKAELEESIEQGFCWWCGATHGVHGKQITNWAHHWSRAHDIRAQHVRDILGVTKRVTFISDETRAKLRKQYAKRDPELLKRNRRISVRRRVRRAAAGNSLPMTAGGRQSLSDKMRKRTKRLWAERRPMMMERIRRGAKNQRSPEIECVVCSKMFWVRGINGGKSRRTCSERCKQSYRRWGYGKFSPRKLRWARKARAAGFRQIDVAQRLGVCEHTLRKYLSAVAATDRGMGG